MILAEPCEPGVLWAPSHLGTSALTARTISSAGHFVKMVFFNFLHFLLQQSVSDSSNLSGVCSTGFSSSIWLSCSAVWLYKYNILVTRVTYDCLHSIITVRWVLRKPFCWMSNFVGVFFSFPSLVIVRCSGVVHPVLTRILWRSQI